MLLGLKREQRKKHALFQKRYAGRYLRETTNNACGVVQKKTLRWTTFFLFLREAATPQKTCRFCAKHVISVKETVSHQKKQKPIKMNKNLLRLLGLQVLGLGLVLSVLEFFIDNSWGVVLIGVVLFGLSFIVKQQ